MNTKLFAAALVLPLAAHGLVYAQDGAALDGQWRGWMKTATGQMEVKLTLKGSGGDWLFYPQPMQSRSNPCYTQLHAISLSEPGVEPRTLTLQGSKLGGGCEDATATLVVDGDAMTLSFPNTRGVLKRR